MSIRSQSKNEAQASESQFCSWRFAFALCLFGVVLFLGCNSQPAATKQVEQEEDPYRETIELIVDSERTILSLSPYISKIADSMTESGSETRDSVRQFFAEETNRVRNGKASAEATENFPQELWQPFLGDRKFTECQFGILSGTFSDSGQRFDMKTKFEGKIRDDQEVIGVHATQTITWTLINKLWTITDWTQHSFEASEPQSTLFVDVTSDFVDNPATRKALDHSSHERLTREAIQQKSVMGPLIPGIEGFNDWESAWQFPSVSIVDYDNDGWDDVFLTDRWDDEIMLKNNKGKFVDATKDAGLATGNMTNCVVFADFDNDGDADAFVGHSLKDSQFFINDGDKYQLDTTMENELGFVRFVTAGSVADFNGDGLLDLYISTYASPSGSVPSNWTDRMIQESDRERFNRANDQHPFTDRGGPANILMINVNGKLQRCETDELISQWRNSYQSVWHDWDSDGDQDLFVCNDFAPDAFLRNDTPRGSSKPIFVDVTEELIGPNIMGYSMGASWGDYDNDGDMDLYVSEMYSKAGNRILKQFAAADKRSVQSAKGNFLFRNDDGKFTEVASAKNVSKIGWAFGGQFADFNNDAWLDLYVPSGFYTAPSEVRSDADL